MSDVFPGLRYRDVPAAMQWLTSVLGLTEQFVVRDATGRVGHAELGWGDGVVMLGPLPEGSDERTPGGGEVYLAITETELRTAHDRAVAAGAKLLHPLQDRGYGVGFTVLDPEGNEWSLGTYRPATSPPVGAPGWLEIGVPEPGPTRDFLSTLFGWQVEAMAAGNANFTGPGLRAGVHGNDEDRSITVYFTVADLDAAVLRVRELGGTAEEAGTAQADFGRFTTATDPQGVPFGLHQPPSAKH